MYKSLLNKNTTLFFNISHDVWSNEREKDSKIKQPMEKFRLEIRASSKTGS